MRQLDTTLLGWVSSDLCSLLSPASQWQVTGKTFLQPEDFAD